MDTERTFSKVREYAVTTGFPGRLLAVFDIKMI